MRVFKGVCTGLVLAALGVTAAFGEISQIGWRNLAPEAEPYENPFEALSGEQIDGLRTILRFRQSEPGQPGAISAEEAAAVQARLEGQGLDIDALFAARETIIERRRAAWTSTRPEIVGREVRLPGYVLPLELVEGKVVEFLLVPTVGACIHTPPPPANQMVHVRYAEGFAVEGLYTPVWITGPLAAELATPTVRYVDGEARVEVSYAMDASLVEPY